MMRFIFPGKVIIELNPVEGEAKQNRLLWLKQPIADIMSLMLLY